MGAVVIVLVVCWSMRANKRKVQKAQISRSLQNAEIPSPAKGSDLPHSTGDVGRWSADRGVSNSPPATGPGVVLDMRDLHGKSKAENVQPSATDSTGDRQTDKTGTRDDIIETPYILEITSTAEITATGTSIGVNSGLPLPTNQGPIQASWALLPQGTLEVKFLQDTEVYR